jgi:glycosyl-4,4'-diaponeurosporenoate acyltransferase
MQIAHLPTPWMVLSFFLGWMAIQLGTVFLGARLPDRAFDAPWFSRRSFETARFYRRLTGVHHWKRLLPDGGEVTRNGFPKRHLENADPAYLRRFILESKRAEAIHWMAILPFWVFGFWSPPIVVPIMLLYALAVNLPCIVAQRYNRPRLVRLLEIQER